MQLSVILSLFSRSPPVALQPSLGHYYAQVNQEWRKGYEVQTSRAGHYLSDPLLSQVVIVSISGGYNDYQVHKYLHTYTCYDMTEGLVHGELVKLACRKKLSSRVIISKNCLSISLPTCTS